MDTTKHEMIETVLTEHGWAAERWSGADSYPVAFLDGWFELAHVDEDGARWLTVGTQGTVALHVPACPDELREFYGPDRVVAVLSRLEVDGGDKDIHCHSVVKHLAGLRRIDDLGDRVNISDLFYEKIPLLGSVVYTDDEDEQEEQG